MISYFIVAFTCGWCLYWLLNNSAAAESRPELACPCGQRQCPDEAQLGCQPTRSLGSVFIRRAALLKKVTTRALQLIAEWN